MSLLVIHLPKRFINAMDQFIKKSLLAWVSHNHTSSKPKTLVRENHNEDGIFMSLLHQFIGLMNLTLELTLPLT